MAGNTFGTLFRITTFGESHGGAVGVVVDGVPPNMELDAADIQKELDRRKPGQSEVTTPRQEPDTAQILSGIFDGKTTGMPMLLILFNKDANPAAYDDIKNLFRPGHADFTYFRKYGIRDYRGSGRASGRETTGRVAAGAIAKKILAGRGILINAFSQAIGGITGKNIVLDEIEKNPLRAADPDAVEAMLAQLNKAKEAGDSVGGIVECRITGVPAGLGEPVFDKLEADLAKAMLSIGAVRGIEFGAGFAAAAMTGSEHNDAMNKKGFVSNNAGGIIGGISTGEEIVFRVAVKPTSSITATQDTVDIRGKEQKIQTHGRHDPCICPRIVPVIEAMAAIVLEDHWKRQAALGA